MLLSLLIIIPFLSALLSVFSYKINKNFPRWICLIGMLIVFCLIIQVWYQTKYIFLQNIDYPQWIYEFSCSWIPRFGINFHLAIDKISFLMVLLTIFLGIISIICSWKEIKENEGFFYFNFMLVLTGVLGVFIAEDLFLFFLFWELTAIPTYFLVVLWGYNFKNKKEICLLSANKFFIYMQISGLLLLISILLLTFNYYRNTHILTFDYNLLINGNINTNIQYIAMIGFFLAFAIKMPIIPFHGWLPDFHVNAPKCAAIEIVSILLKTAPYAILRYHLFLFPHMNKIFLYIVIFLGFLNIFYGSILAFSQVNIKRFIAYSSISHMGLILVSMYIHNTVALQGAIVQIVSNSISTSALCVLTSYLCQKCHTQDIRKMCGLWKHIYWIPGFYLFFSLANLGLPGTGNFVGELLMLFGVFQVYPIVSILLTTYIIFSSIYSLNMMQKIFYGKCRSISYIFLIKKKEIYIIVSLIIVLIFLGMCPQKILNFSHFSI